MDENKSNSPDKSAPLLIAKVKRIIFLFFAVLGGAFFFSSIFIALYISLGFVHNFPGYSEYKEDQIPIADGRKLYEDMQQMKKEKAKDLAELIAEERFRSQKGDERHRGDHIHK